MRKIKLNYWLIGLCLIAFITSCNKDSIQKEEAADQGVDFTKDGYIKLKSGVVIKKQGTAYTIQGDIRLTAEQVNLLDKEGRLDPLVSDDIDASKENSVPPSSGKRFFNKIQTKSVGRHPAENRMWAMVRYVINPSLSFSARLAVSQAISYWEEHTNVRFYNATGEPTVDPTWGFHYPYLEFFHGSDDGSSWNSAGDWSYIGRWDIVKNMASHGRTDAGQWLSLSTYPLTGTVIHEIGHAIGLYHEHTRPDRDTYITVHFDRIDPSYSSSTIASNWGKLNTPNYSMFGALDLESIMMYHPLAGASGSLPVITVNGSTTGYVHNDTDLSFLDRKYANSYYLPYIARSDTYAELDNIVYKDDNTVMSPSERLSLQAALNYGNPNPPNCCRLPNNH